MSATLLTVILLLSQAIGAILDNIRAATYTTSVGDYFLNHTHYLIITYFSSITGCFMACQKVHPAFALLGEIGSAKRRDQHS